MNDNNKMTVQVGRKAVVVASLKDASETVRAATRFVGSSEWYGTAKGVGNVFVGGKCIAHVSYNGRVWEPGPFPQPEIKVD